MSNQTETACAAARTRMPVTLLARAGEATMGGGPTRDADAAVADCVPELTFGATARACDAGMLAGLARELSTIETLPQLREAIGERLALLLPSRDVCVVAARQGTWQTIIGRRDAHLRRDAYAWTPLDGRGRASGRLLVGIGRERGRSAELLEATATLIGVAVQHLLTIEELRQQGVRDALTGCFNQGHAHGELEAQMRTAARTHLPISILMIDIDRFKGVNDRYGHVAGDAVLAAVGERLVRRLRQGDVACRVGGDEFLVILPDAPLRVAIGLADSLRRGLAQIRISSPRGPITITGSIGVAAGAAEDHVSAFIDRADTALYRAKRAGGNRVRACEAEGVVNVILHMDEGE